MNKIRTIQAFIYEQTQGHSRKPVKDLMRFLNDSVVLDTAWKQVSRASGKRTPGQDGVTVNNVITNEGGPQRFIHELASELQEGRYQPGAVRQFEIKKRNDPSKKRKLAILNLKDRIVHTAIKLILEPVVEYHLGKRAFGFRPRRSRYDELVAVQRQVQNNPDRYQIALTADIATCFDVVDHNVIKHELGRLVGDTKLIALIEIVLGQVRMTNKGWVHRRSLGILQGSALSPLLANLALLPFDSAWSRFHGNDHPLYRYADDLVVLTESRRSARKLLRKMDALLWKKSRMKLAREKTSFQAFEDGVSLLGMQIRRHREPYRKQYLTSLMTDSSTVQDILFQIDVWGEELERNAQVDESIKKLNRKLNGWFESYQFAYDAPQAFAAIDHHVFRVVRARLKKNLNCSSSLLSAEHHTYLDSGHETWQYNGETVMVLSAQQRRQYRPDAEMLPWESLQKVDCDFGNGSLIHLPPYSNRTSQHQEQEYPVEQFVSSAANSL